jgi:chromosome segregation ATPase
MLKKLLLVGVIAAGVVGAVSLTKVGTRVRHEARSAVHWLDEQMPVEKKISMLRSEVGNLDRDIEKIKNELAKEIVAVRELTTTTNQLRAAVETENKQLVTRAEEIKDSTTKVKVGGAFISVPEATKQLNKDVNAHLTKKKSLEAYEKALTSREKIVKTLSQQFDTVKSKKEEFLAQIDEFEAEYKALQLQQMESKFQTDDTRLANLKKELANLNRNLEIEKTKLELEPRKYSTEAATTSTSESIDNILNKLNGAEKIDAAK